jgi:hypothetical protein
MGSGRYNGGSNTDGGGNNYGDGNSNCDSDNNDTNANAGINNSDKDDTPGMCLVTRKQKKQIWTKIN